jgi:CBS domain-containing protein
MLIGDLLKHKGGSVVTIAPDETIPTVLASLAEHHIGALVVLDGQDIVGIISERDVVRALHSLGEDVLRRRVRDLMTTTVVSASPADPVERIAGLMTDHRVRHMPVLDDGRLTGIVTIGDVVAARIRQLEQDRGQLEHYITQGR